MMLDEVVPTNLEIFYLTTTTTKAVGSLNLTPLSPSPFWRGGIGGRGYRG